MDLRYAQTREYVRSLQNTAYEWRRCISAFEELSEIWLKNSNQASESWKVTLEARSQLELAGEYLGRAFTVKFVQKANGENCFGQVLVIVRNPISEEPTLVCDFVLNHHGELVGGDGKTVVPAVGGRDYRDYCLLCEVCLRISGL